MDQKRLIQTHFAELIVEVIDIRAFPPRTGPFRTDDLIQGQRYRVLATAMHTYGDGSTVPIFLVQGPEGKIVERACELFKVAEIFTITTVPKE